MKRLKIASLLLCMTVFNSGVIAAERAPNFVQFSTLQMPEGIELKISHNMSYVSSLGVDNIPLIQAYHNSLSYSFSFASGRKINASMSFFQPQVLSIERCEEAGSSKQMVHMEARNWPEVKMVLLTAAALGFTEMRILGSEGYEQIELVEFDLTEADVLAWIDAAMSYAEGAKDAD